jgi:hypothetical protein
MTSAEGGGFRYSSRAEAEERLRHAAERVREKEGAGWSGEHHQPWPHWRYDLREIVHRTFDREIISAMTLPQRLTELKAKLGKNLIAVELCGAGRWEGEPISHTINVTLTDDGHIPKHPDQTIIEGSIFELADVRELMRAIEHERAELNAEIGCVVLSPGQGLASYWKHELAWMRLYQLVTHLYKRLPEGGEMYLTNGKKPKLFRELCNRTPPPPNTPPVCEAPDPVKVLGSCVHLTKQAYAPELPKITELGVDSAVLEAYMKEYAISERVAGSGGGDV